MKKLLFIFILFISFRSVAQFPINATNGTPTTTVLTRGVLAVDSAFRLRTNFTDTATANLGLIDQLPGATIRTGDIIWMRNNLATEWINISSGGGISELTPFNGCISGCTVTWLQNFDYEVAPSVYYINGTRYESPKDTVTLSASDPQDDRIDVFVVNTSNQADKVTGTPADPPVEPQINPLTQLRISFALVDSAATAPTIANLWIYREDAGPPAEWDFTTAAGSINLASTNFPYAGTKDIEATAMPSGASFTGASADSVFSGAYDALVFKIRSKADWGVNTGLYIYFQNDTTGFISPPVLLINGRYGFTSTNTSAYQNVTIPLTEFGPINGSTVIKFVRTTNAGTIGFYLDDVQLMNINLDGFVSGNQLQGLQDVILYNNVFTQDNVVELNSHRWDLRQGILGIQVSTNGYADIYGSGQGDLRIDVQRIFTERIDLGTLRVSSEIGMMNNAPITSYSGHVNIRPDASGYYTSLIAPNQGDTTSSIMQFIVSGDNNPRIGELRFMNGSSSNASIPSVIYTAGYPNDKAGHLHLRTGVSLTTTDTAQGLFRYTNSQFGNYDIYLEPSGQVKLSTPTQETTSTFVLIYNTPDSSVRMIPTDSIGGGAGTVSSFAFTDGSGFDGTVTDATTTPTLSLTTSLTTGSVPFIGASGALSQNNANFHWDNSNVRLSIGAGTSPIYKIQVKGPNSLLYLEASGDGSANTPHFLLSNGSTDLEMWAASNVSNIGNFGNTDLVFNTNSTERMRIKGGGNVGIGVDPSWQADILETATALTTNTRVLNVANTGSTFNTTAGNLTSSVGFFSNTATRSAGVNDLTNIGVYATASGGQTNFAAYFEGSTNVVVGASGQLRVDGSGSNIIQVTNSSVTTFNVNSNGVVAIGQPGSLLGSINLSGNTSGTISILPQAAAGTFNFNLPITAGTSGHLLTSAGGGSSAMTWTDPATITGVNIYNANGTLINGPRTVTGGTVLTTWTSSQTSTGAYAFNVQNSTGGGSIGASNAGLGNAVAGSTTSGNGLFGGATSGNGLTATATTGIAATFRTTIAATNTETLVLRITKGSDGTAAAGLGGFLGLQGEDEAASDRDIVRLGWVWTTVNGASSTGDFKVSTINAGSMTEKFRITGDGRHIFTGRILPTQGADVASVAGAIAVGLDGNVFELTGTNAVTLISNVGWQNGAQITFVFTSTATLTDGTANSGTDIGMELAGNANFVGSADDVITLVLSEMGGTQRWRELSRTVN